MNESLLQQFWFVTTTSLYRVYRADDGIHVMKIDCPAQSKVPIGTELPQADFLGITSREGVFFYIDDRNPMCPARENPPLPEDVNMQYWLGGTSAVSGLFLQEEDARKAFQQKDEPAEASWMLERTQEVIHALEGDPKIICTHSPTLGFSFT
ncbi:MAG TPA: hypothetical protein VLG69_01285 [Candidatus Andersenbacteria bacterium]|nr:hypothetical protein [Candidatus Andersenbacteria bacterium]